MTCADMSCGGCPNCQPVQVEFRRSSARRAESYERDRSYVGLTDHEIEVLNALAVRAGTEDITALRIAHAVIWAEQHGCEAEDRDEEGRLLISSPHARVYCWPREIETAVRALHAFEAAVLGLGGRNHEGHEALVSGAAAGNQSRRTPRSALSHQGAGSVITGALPHRATGMRIHEDR